MANEWRKWFPDATRNEAEVLLDGEAYFESVIKAIETAKAPGHYIYILGWMLDVNFHLVKNKDETLFKLLNKATGNGVEVRILIWDNPIQKYSELLNAAITLLKKLPNTKAFIDNHTFFPQQSKIALQQIAISLIKPTILSKILINATLGSGSTLLETNFEIPLSYIVSQLVTLSSHPTLGAHHEKVVIVKGEADLIAFCGGLDFNKNRVISEINKKEYRFPAYHDTACRLQGPAAHEVLQRFKRRWRNHPEAKTESLSGQNEAIPKEYSAPYPYAKVVGTYNSPDGREKEDRSLSKAYFLIIDKAKHYIYIEDQYLVNLDVARALNKKIREPNFQKLTFVIQDSIETSDILIPNRKRCEFMKAVLSGTTDVEAKKVLLAVIDRAQWDREQYHPGLHAKTLIVDDEIAIIGSANVNRRGFTVDSETSVIVFDDDAKVDNNFALKFRIKTWKEFLRKRAKVPPLVYESWWNFPTEIDRQSNYFSILIKYGQHMQDDLDERIKAEIKRISVGVAGEVALHVLVNPYLAKTTAVLLPQYIDYIFNTLWEHFIDPKAD